MDPLTWHTVVAPVLILVLLIIALVTATAAMNMRDKLRFTENSYQAVCKELALVRGVKSLEHQACERDLKNANMFLANHRQRIKELEEDISKLRSDIHRNEVVPLKRQLECAQHQVRHLENEVFRLKNRETLEAIRHHQQPNRRR